MNFERLIGIDFGTSTSVVRTKIYDSKGSAVGQPLFAQPVVFNNGASMVPTVVRRTGDQYSFGYDAEIPSRNSEVFRSFKVKLQSDDPEEVQEAKTLTEKYFEYLYGEYEHQLVTGYLGDPQTKDVTIVSYPVKWENDTREFMIETAKAAGFENVVGMDEAEAAIRAVSLQCRDILKKNGLLFDGNTANVMLVDMGAGTTDIVICKYTPGEKPMNEILTTWPKGGDVLFGGQEMDVLLKDYIISKFPKEYQDQVKNKITIDRIKAWKENTLSPAMKNNLAVKECGDADNIAYYLDVELDDFCLDREAFETLFEDYIGQFVRILVEALTDSGLSPEDIDLVVLTGGHSKWYFVEDILTGKSARFGEFELKKIKEDPNRILSVALPQETVALGLVYSRISGTLSFNKSEHLWKTYIETGSINALEEAVELGSIDAMNEFAFKLNNGVGIAKNREKAIELYKKAAQHGHAQAHYNLGCCYFEEKNYDDAIVYFKNAADLNVPEAVNNLGICYRYGFGVEKNTEKALELFKRAFDLGCMSAKTCYNDLLKSAFPGRDDNLIDFDGKDVIEYMKKIDPFSGVIAYFTIGSAPQNKINNFTAMYPHEFTSSEKILCFFDNTWLGSGKTGFMLTEKKFYWHMFGGAAFSTPISEIESFTASGDGAAIITLKNKMSNKLPFYSHNNYPVKLAAFLSKTLEFIKNT